MAAAVTGTGDPRGQVPGAMSKDGNAHPMPFITPGDWGDLRKWKLTLTGGAVVNLMEELCNQHTDFPNKMLELTFWSVMNYQSRIFYVGAEDVAEDEDYPVAALAGDIPGFHAMKTDPRKVYLLLPGSGEQEVIVHLSGKGLR